MKSLEELKEIRERALKKINVRQLGEQDDIKVMVGMGTCGIAQGARQTLQALIEAISDFKLENVYVVQVGCMGQCYAEPQVQIEVPGKEPVVYGRVTAQKAKEIVERHLVKGEILEELTVEANTQY
ncbi:(2Fe-2S) ferredoxin domain-containing protein [Alkaliphilus crotonatoxidans]